MTDQRHSMRARALTLALLCGGIAAANATAIDIFNAGFELPVLADGAGTVFSRSGNNDGVPGAGIFGWSITGFGGGAMGNPAVGDPSFPSGMAWEGNNGAYAVDASVSQALTAQLAPGTYALSAAIGNPADRPDDISPSFLQLFVAESGRVLFTSDPIAAADIMNGTLKVFSVVGTVARNDADLGKHVGVRVVAGGAFNGTHSPFYGFDDVRLDFTASPVPEPASGALAAAGVALLVLRKRRARSPGRR